MTKEISLFVITILIFSLICVPPIFAVKPIQTAQKTVVIDPGHGGKQTGLVSPAGLNEKDITLKLALKIQNRLENRYNVYLTRKTDTDISAEDRIAAANRRKADLFVSIHLHDAGNPMALVYVFDIREGVEVPKTISEHSWLYSPLKFNSKSRQAAKSFEAVFASRKHMPQKVETKILYGPIFLLEGSAMPSVLIEPLSISLLPAHPARLEIVLEEYSLPIADSIIGFFTNHSL